MKSYTIFHYTNHGWTRRGTSDWDADHHQDRLVSEYLKTLYFTIKEDGPSLDDGMNLAIISRDFTTYNICCKIVKHNRVTQKYLR